MTDPAPNAQEELATRLRALLSGRVVREVRMFGGQAFMVDERLAVSAGRNGDLLVRANEADYNEHLDRGAVESVMKNGRRMGRAWLTVPAPQIIEDEELAYWLAVAIEAGE